MDQFGPEPSGTEARTDGSNLAFRVKSNGLCKLESSSNLRLCTFLLPPRKSPRLHSTRCLDASTTPTGSEETDPVKSAGYSSAIFTLRRVGMNLSCKKNTTLMHNRSEKGKAFASTTCNSPEQRPTEHELLARHLSRGTCTSF